MLRLSVFILFIAMSWQASALTFKSGESIQSSNQPQQVEIIAPPDYVVPKVNFNGNHYRAGLRVGKKYALPLKSATSKNNGATGQDSHEWRTRLNSFMQNFHAVGDFNNDGIQDFVVTAFRHGEMVLKDVNTVNIYEYGVSKHRFFKVYAGDSKTGWGNDYYRQGGEDITHLFIEDPIMAGLADHQLSSQKPLVADFNGDGIDDLYFSSAMNSSETRKRKDVFFGGFHSYYLSQPDGTFKESSREMMKGKWVDEKTGRYIEFAHRSDVGDLDGDGDIDVVHASVSWKGNNGHIICMFNDGTGYLTSEVCGEQWGNQVKIGDFNGDSAPDLLALGATYKCIERHGRVKEAHASRNRHTPRIIFGNGSGKFYNRQGIKFDDLGKQQMANGEDIFLCGMPTARVADVDNDGDQDIIGNTIGYLYVGGYFQIFLNDGEGNFSLGQQIVAKQPNVHYSLDNWPKHESNHSSQGYCFSMLTLDLNSDGYIDFFCDGGFMQPTDGFLYINKGDGTFSKASKATINKYASVF